MKWKDVNCPTCEAKVGESCGKIKLGTLSCWVRTAPHAARKRLAESSVAFEQAAERAFEVVKAIDEQPYTTLQKAASVAASIRGLQKGKVKL